MNWPVVSQKSEFSFGYLPQEEKFSSKKNQGIFIADFEIGSWELPLPQYF
jgi:hypothetical protein